MRILKTIEYNDEYETTKTIMTTKSWKELSDFIIDNMNDIDEMDIKLIPAIEEPQYIITIIDAIVIRIIKIKTVR